MLHQLAHGACHRRLYGSLSLVMSCIVGRKTHIHVKTRLQFPGYLLLPVVLS